MLALDTGRAPCFNGKPSRQKGIKKFLADNDTGVFLNPAHFSRRRRSLLGIASFNSVKLIGASSFLLFHTPP